MSLIASGIKDGACYDAWEFVSRHCANGKFQIQGIGFYQYYSPGGNKNSSQINIDIADIHRLTDIILDYVLSHHPNICTGSNNISKYFSELILQSI